MKKNIYLREKKIFLVMKIIRSEWLGGGLRSDYRMRKDGF